MVNKDVIHSEPLVQYVLLWKIYWKNSKIYHIKWCRILKHHSVLNKYCVTSKWPNTNHYKKNTCFATFAQKISSWQNAIQSKHVLKLQFLQVLVKHSGGVVLHQKTEKKNIQSILSMKYGLGVASSQDANDHQDDITFSGLGIPGP